MKTSEIIRVAFLFILCFLFALVLIAFVSDLFIAKHNNKLLIKAFCPECISKECKESRHVARECIAKNIKVGLSRKEIHTLFSRYYSCKKYFSQKVYMHNKIETEESGEKWVCTTAYFFSKYIGSTEIFIFYDNKDKVISYFLSIIIIEKCNFYSKSDNIYYFKLNAKEDIFQIKINMLINTLDLAIPQFFKNACQI